MINFSLGLVRNSIEKFSRCHRVAKCFNAQHISNKMIWGKNQTKTNCIRHGFVYGHRHTNHLLIAATFILWCGRCSNYKLKKWNRFLVTQIANYCSTPCQCSILKNWLLRWKLVSREKYTHQWALQSILYVAECSSS